MVQNTPQLSTLAVPKKKEKQRKEQVEIKKEKIA